MKNNRTKGVFQPRFGVDVSISFVTQVLILGFSFVSSIIIARALGPKGKGLFSLALTIPTMAATLINMGINYSNVYFIGKKKHPIGSIVGNTILYSFSVGVNTAFILLIVAPFLSSYFMKDAPRIYLYTTLTLIPFLLISENIYYILLGYREMVKLSISRLINPLTYLAILVCLYYFFHISVYGAIYANILGLLFSLLIGVYFIIKSGYCLGLAINKTIFIETLKFGFKQHLGTIFQVFNYRLDMLIVAALLTSSEVGQYSISVLIAETVWYIPGSLGQVLYPKTASSEPETINKFTPLVCRTNILLTSIAVMILYTLSGIIIPWLFTFRFLPSVMALKLLLPGIFFLGISKILGSDLIGRGFPQYSTFAALVSLIFTVIFNLLLIPRFGINGAALASSISYAVSALVIIYLFKRTTGIRISDILIFRTGDIIIYQRPKGGS